MASPDRVPGEEYDYEALPSNYSLGHNMIAGAFAGIAVCLRFCVSLRRFRP
ncbi:hypothetical protein CISG_01020 [Coccidioides immitis RMSCC 3703]|uniref:Uncharacterized protein n=1 Tax=Coccidioides immitis RMSCC 3703 TaxID=454286 RepID=A0A0J8QW43_COCIT|nr:hypothetical protein CISG_01020 [Coccidioides immitis RMSCC 3703]